jgi:hypothetical protein
MKYSPILNGMTNGSNCICRIFLKSLTGQGYNVAGIDPPWTHKNAFAAKHAFLYALAYFLILSSFQKDLKFPQTKIGKISGRAGCRAASAFDANPETRFPFRNKISYMPAIGIVVDLASF